MTMPAVDPAQQQPVPPPFSLTVNNPTPPPPAPTGQQFMTREEVEALVNAAREQTRQEEKNKLYPHIEEQQQQIAQLTRFREEAEAERAAAEQQAAEAERIRLEGEMTALQRLEAYQSEQEKRFATIQEERDRDRLLLQREREFAKVNEYKVRRLAEESETIAPQLLDFVTGFTEEEIESSVQLAVRKSEEILNEMRSRMDQQPGYRPPVIPVSGTPMVDPNDLTGAAQQVELTVDQIAAMTPAEYAAYRPQLHAALGQHIREHGLYR